jgi:hypothetical protein
VCSSDLVTAGGTSATSSADQFTYVVAPTVATVLPNTGPLAGGTTVTITGIGAFQVPPAVPGTGVTVYPNFIFGRGSYGQVMLDDVKFTYLKDADKSDPINQLRVVGWKCFYGTLIQNVQFAMRIESTSAFNSTFG